MALRNLPLVDIAYWTSPDGQGYDFQSGRRFLFTWAGLGPVDPTYLSDRGPFQDGITVRDYRLPERVIDLTVYLRGLCRDDYWNSQGELSDILRPNRAGGPGKLGFITSTGAAREIWAWILSGPQGAYDAASSTLVSDQIQALRFLCPDPVFFDPEQVSVTLEALSIGSDIIFYSVDYPDHFQFPFVFGANILSGSQNITYTGTYKAYPVIVITGPVSNPKIRNETTGEEIALDYDVGSGEVVTIDLYAGNRNQKTIRSSTGANLIGTVLNPNDLASFHLEAAPLAPGGLNVLSVSGSNAGPGQTSIILTYYTRYLGVPN